MGEREREREREGRGRESINIKASVQIMQRYIHVEEVHYSPDNGNSISDLQCTQRQRTHNKVMLFITKSQCHKVRQLLDSLQGHSALVSIIYLSTIV